jgi:DNA polymerase (family 10)
VRIGRLLGSRETYDLDHVMEMAVQTHTGLEINANDERLDLTDIQCIVAKGKEVMISIGTDTHHPEQMWTMSLGVTVARRGWLEKENVLTCLPLDLSSSALRHVDELMSSRSLPKGSGSKTVESIEDLNPV